MPRVMKAHPERGAALVAVIWVSMSVALLSITFLTSMRQETRASAFLSQGAYHHARLEAGLARAMHDLLVRPDDQRMTRFGAPFQFFLEGQAIEVRISDENGRMNVNLAPENFLADVIESVTGEDGAALAAAIADWRDADQTPRSSGTERSWYVAQEQQDLPEDGPFQTIKDLANVRGMTPELHTVLIDLFTVHTNTRTIDPVWAPEALLRAMPGATEAFVGEVLEARIDGGPLPPMPSPGWVSEATGPVYRIHVRAGPMAAQWIVWIRQNEGEDTIVVPLEQLPDMSWLMSDTETDN